MIYETLYCVKVLLPKKPPKLLELLSEFSKIADYKINIQKTAPFMYTSNEISERVSKVFFKIISKNLKYLEINSIKDVKDLYSENY